MSARSGAGPIAIIPWSDLIEDFLDHVGVSLEQFATEMTGGWLFGYVSALQRQRMDSLVVVFSARAVGPRRLTHSPTGIPIFVLPASRAYCVLRERGVNPYGLNAREMFGEAGAFRRLAYASTRPLVPYLGTPLLRLTSLVRDYECAAILCQEYEYARFDLCTTLGRFVGVPVFATCQGGTFPHSSFERRLRPLTLRLCAGVIIGSRQEAERVQRAYRVPPAKVAIIPNPLDADEWSTSERSEARAELGLHSEVVVAWHGRVDLFVKGLDVLLAAWQILVARHQRPDVRLLLVGTGRDAAELRRQLDAMPSGVTWIDEYVLDKRRVARYLSAADIYAFPSRSEGFPVAPLEAMAEGLPVVASDVAGIRDIFPEGAASGGVLVPVADARALAAALGRLIDDADLRARIGLRARLRVETSFSLDAVGEQLGRFFRSAGVRLSAASHSP